MCLADAKFDCRIQLHYVLVLVTVCCRYFAEVHAETRVSEKLHVQVKREAHIKHSL